VVLPIPFLHALPLLLSFSPSHVLFPETNLFSPKAGPLPVFFFSGSYIPLFLTDRLPIIWMRTWLPPFFCWIPSQLLFGYSRGRFFKGREKGCSFPSPHVSLVLWFRSNFLKSPSSPFFLFEPPPLVKSPLFSFLGTSSPRVFHNPTRAVDFLGRLFSGPANLCD